MQAKTPRKNGSTTENEPLNSVEVLGLLANEHRLEILRHVTEAVGPVTLDALTDRLAQNYSHRENATERVRVGLYHVHAPKLADAGLIEFDEDRATVQLAVSATALAPFLDVASEWVGA